jgi:O-antigen ligase
MFDIDITAAKHKNPLIIFGIIACVLLGIGISIYPLLFLAVPVIALILIVLISPITGLYVLMFSFAFEYYFVVGESTTITRLVGIFVFALWIVSLLINRKPIQFGTNKKIWFAMLAFILWAFLTGLWAVDPGGWFGNIQSYVSYIFLFVLLINLIKNEKELENAYFWICAGALLIVVIPLVNWIISGASLDQALYRQGFGNINRNAYASFLLALVPLTLSAAKISNSNIKKVFWLIFSLAFTAGIIFSLSRSAILGLIAAIAIYVLLSLDLRRAIIIGLLILVLFAITTESDLISNRISIIYNPTAILETTQSNIRIEIWRRGWSIFSEHPLLGVGSGGYKEAMLEIARIQGPITDNVVAAVGHNFLITPAVEIGIVGLFLWINFLIQTVSQLRSTIITTKNHRSVSLSRGLLASIGGLLIYGFGHDLDTIKIFWLILSFSITLVGLKINISDEENK